MTMLELKLYAQIFVRIWGKLNIGLLCSLIVCGIFLYWQQTYALQLHRDFEKELTAIDKELAVQSSSRQIAKESVEILKQQKFLDLLGDANYLEQEVKRILEIAHQTDVLLSAGEYRKSDNPHGRYTTYSMKFPLRGSYLQIRRFVEHCLLQMPYVSLDELSFHRVSISQAVLEAKVSFTIYSANEPKKTLVEKFE